MSAAYMNRQNEDDVESDDQVNRKNSEWTEEDLSALAKAMAKFPGGTPGRWDRIAHQIGRTVQEVTKKVKEMKTSLCDSGTIASGNQTSVAVGKRAAFQISDNIISKAIESELSTKPIITVTQNELYMTQDDIPDDYDQGFSNNDDEDSDIEQYRQVRKRKVKTRKEVPKEEEQPEDSTEEENKTQCKEDEKEENKQEDATKEKENLADVWSQVQQKCLENALAQIPKSRTDRWTHIARAVPGKTKVSRMGFSILS
ncbi:dnaJ homolog subfamily C member 1-like [Rhopilema esculentum]|uniref:dnaJ homolog subfamily C member 1-like n=1 Tax=Rhopilema esculentum TaxID=499914 RepID=UPI0031D62D27